MSYAPVSSKDLSGAGATDQVVSGRAGTFEGVSVAHGAADVAVDVFDGTADTDKLIWTGQFESNAESWVGVVVPQGGISYSRGLFIKFSVDPAKAVVYFT